MKVGFRVDSSLEIGNGHLMRCLSLADALRNRGARCIFIARKHQGHSIEAIQQRGYETLPLPSFPPAKEQGSTLDARLSTPYARWLGVDWKTDARDSLSALNGRVLDWMVVDHYALDAQWERILRGACSRVLVIDDLANRVHDCDVLLDQNLGRAPDHYFGFVPDHSLVLAGPAHALLRPQFAQLRSMTIKRRVSQSLPVHLLVAFGGVDKDNVTEGVLDSLAKCELPDETRITVVMGSRAPWLKNVRERAERMRWPTEVKIDVVDMATIMSRSDCAIGAGGTMAWERCCMALPSIILVTAENQRPGAHALRAAGCAILIESVSELEMALRRISTTGAMRRAVRACAGTVDGIGAERVASRIYSISNSKYSLRPLSQDHLDLVLAWRNHPKTRKVMFNQNLITREEHYTWFQKLSSDDSHRAYVLEENGKPNGFVQFSGLGPGAIVNWGFYTAPDAPKGTGLRLGRCALDLAFGEMGVRKICGRVLSANKPSVDFHRRMGFREEGTLREEHKTADGYYEDLIHFGLLSSEWAVKGSELAK